MTVNKELLVKTLETIKQHPEHWNSSKIILHCTCCGKQAMSWKPSYEDRYLTTLIGARAVSNDEVICGYCVEDLDGYESFTNNHQ